MQGSISEYDVALIYRYLGMNGERTTTLVGWKAPNDGWVKFILMDLVFLVKERVVEALFGTIRESVKMVSTKMWDGVMSFEWNFRES